MLQREWAYDWTEQLNRIKNSSCDCDHLPSLHIIVCTHWNASRVMSICIRGHLTMQNDIIVTCSEVKHLFSSLRDTSSKYSNTKRDKNLQSIVVMKLSPAVGFIGDRSLRVGYNSTWDLSLHHIHNYILFSHVSL